jgi:arylformamidase
MSGMFEMAPVRLSWRRTYVNFDDGMADAMSPQRHIDKLHAPITVTYGTWDTPDFQRQRGDFAAAVKAAGKPVQVVEVANYHHQEMVESLGNPY